MGRFNSKKTAERLYNDIGNLNLDANISQLLAKMDRGLTPEQREQYREVYADDPNALANLEGKQRQQKQYLSQIQAAMNTIKRALASYKDITTNKREANANLQQRFWDTISTSYETLNNALTGYQQNGNNFPVNDDQVIFSVKFFASKLNKDFLFPKYGNLDKAKIGNNLHYKIGKPRKVRELDYSLFPHNPDPQDLTQGDMDDCFMHSSLYTIANTAPQAIRDAMVDNKDGTVTVRFYGSEKLGGALKPVYVTVPKIEAPNGNTGAMWTYMMEQAFALSGLGAHPQGVIKKDNEQINLNRASAFLRFFRIPSNQNISWGQVRQEGASKGYQRLIQPGSAAFFTKMILGPKVKAKQYQLVAHQPSPMYDDKGKEVLFETIDTKEKQLEMFRNVLANGDVISCGIQDTTRDKVNGIETLHAYTIVAIDENDNITLQNPHNGQDREGEFQMTYEEFKNTFTEFSVAEIPPEYKFKEPSKVQENYRDIVENMTNALEDQNKWYHILFKRNSQQFKDLSASLATLNATLHSENVSEADITAQMQDVVKKATAYENYAAAHQKSGRYRDNRVNIAQSAKILGGLMAANPEKDPHAEFNTKMKEKVAEKIADGFNKKFGDKIAGHETTKEQFLEMPLFQKMVNTQENTFDLAFKNPPDDLMEKMQGELKKVNQHITVEKQIAPEAQRVNENAGPGMQQG